jgi:hypothetical protein
VKKQDDDDGVKEEEETNALGMNVDTQRAGQTLVIESRGARGENGAKFGPQSPKRM